MKRISLQELLAGGEPGDDVVLGGDDLRRAYWRIKGAEKDRLRDEAFWEATNDALAVAYEELEKKSTELKAARAELETRVREQVVEILHHATEVEVLNAQLRAQVHERSRELAVALRRLEAVDVDLPRGTVVGGRARVVRPIGRGGMGDVYLADDLVSGRRVALKLLRPELGRNPDMVQRFLVEATAAAMVDHPSVVRTLHVDVTEDGRLYQLIEYVRGITLRTFASGRSLPVPAAVGIAVEVARALAAAHGQGVIHRDVKPANVILAPVDPGVRVLDFGLSRLLAGERDLESRQTRAGAILGTPAYMAPEQMRDATSAGAPADVYSLGVMLHELLAGRLPFTGETDALILQHISAEPPRLQGDVPDELATLVLSCLAKDPAARPTARSLVGALDAIAVAVVAPPACELVAADPRLADDAVHPTLAATGRGV